jgi:hypothetical protein
MQTTALGILIPLSLAFLGLFGKFSFDMRQDRNYRGSWFWAAAAVLPGLLGAIYLTSDPTMTVALRSAILGTLGAAVGACVAVWIGYVISQPVSAQVTPGSAPPSPTAPPPSVTIQGDNNIFNFGSAGNITLNSEPTAREAMLDPDGLYQFNQKVAVITAAEIDRSNSQVQFKKILSEGSIIDIAKEFQYREYILKFVRADSEGRIGGTAMRPAHSFTSAVCEIMGRIDPTN